MSYSSDGGGGIPKTHFRAYNFDDGMLGISFDSIDGDLMLTSTSLALDQIPFEALLAQTKVSTSYDTTYFIDFMSDWDNLTPFAFSIDNTEGLDLRVNLGGSPNAPKTPIVCVAP